MVRSVSSSRRAPPRARHTGMPYRLPQRSYTAMSTAALAEVFFTMQAWSFFITPSRSSTSMPTRAGRMKSRTAHSMEPMVSPVMTAVGGASP